MSNRVSFSASFFFFFGPFYSSRHQLRSPWRLLTPASFRSVKSHHSLCSPMVRFVWAGANEAAAAWMRARSGPNKRTDTSLKRWSWYIFKRTAEAFARCENAIRPRSDPNAEKKKQLCVFWTKPAAVVSRAVRYQTRTSVSLFYIREIHILNNGRAV